ncbi:MAG: acyl-CoA dehydrogenase family protein [Candidatus Binatia bacterium]
MTDILPIEKGPSPYYTEEHAELRTMVRRFVEAEIRPHADAWDEAEEFPRELYRKAGAAGLLGIGFPEEYGGAGGDWFHRVVLADEIANGRVGGVPASLFSLHIGVPPILALASEALKRRLVPAILAGEKISALAITEPSGGSDVARMKTSARRDGDSYVINGSKTFITSGVRADVVTVAVRTGGQGMGGISLLVVEGDTPGFSRTPLKKMGWWCSDTATLYFDDCRVPAANLLGEENRGFAGVMRNFNSERLGLAAQCYGFGRVCYEDALAYARERETFGKRLADHQVIRHKLVDMATRLESLKAYLDLCAYQMNVGDASPASLGMLKNVATGTLEFCAKEGVQIFGGAGYLRGASVERIYRETKVLSIGGGAEEIMKDLAARQMGI